MRPAAALAGLLLLAACSVDDGGDQVVAAASDGADGTGTIHVRLEDVGGHFIEGFEVGLRFETAEGERLAATLWRDVVAASGRDDIDAWYDAVHAQPVPAGAVRVLAEANIGPGGPPSIPDLDGELPCELVVEVGPGDDVEVVVGFEGGDGCLRRAGDPPPTTTTTAPPEPTPVAPGTSHDVDVDLECQAFELEGTWVLVEGDTSSWQPAGERHEGGTFTLESATRGRFSGDAQGVKRAVFERLPEGAEPACAPVPRPGA